jgi:BCD family chlorophyll transporter-like MFS transporter
MMLTDMFNPRRWLRIDPRLLPFADLATPDLPMGRLLRLSLFQVSVGLVTALLVGTLNRVLIVELGVAAWLVAAMVALPVLVAPFRALIGFRSDTHRSFLGLRRLPYLWLGTLLSFGGLAILPFALILLSGDTHWPLWIGPLSAALAFFMIGLGAQTVQTAGLALATDLAAPESRGRMVALMYAMLLAGMLVSGASLSMLLDPFSKFKLIQVVQGAAFVVMVLNLLAMWKQEPRCPEATRPDGTRPDFRQTWQAFIRAPGHRRFLVAVFAATAAFSMQDIILEPYGAEVLGLTVAETSFLTVLMAMGALAAFGLSVMLHQRGLNPHLLTTMGLLGGLVAFSLVILAEPLQSPAAFRLGTLFIGFGAGMVSIGTLISAMNLEDRGFTGMALGAWGAVQATSLGLAMAAGGVLRDLVGGFALAGGMGPVLQAPATGYAVVYQTELILLFISLAALGPLVKRVWVSTPAKHPFGLADFPR